MIPVPVEAVKNIRNAVGHLPTKHGQDARGTLGCMINRRWFLAVIFAVATTSLAAPAQSPPGLIATFSTKNSQPDSRVVRMPALYVPAGSPASTFTPADPFSATIKGNLKLRLRDELSFSLVGRGQIKL